MKGFRKIKLVEEEIKEKKEVALELEADYFSALKGAVVKKVNWPPPFAGSSGSFVELIIDHNGSLIRFMCDPKTLFVAMNQSTDSNTYSFLKSLKQRIFPKKQIFKGDLNWEKIAAEIDMVPDIYDHRKPKLKELLSDILKQNGCSDRLIKNVIQP